MTEHLVDSDEGGAYDHRELEESQDPVLKMPQSSKKYFLAEDLNEAAIHQRQNEEHTNETASTVNELALKQQIMPPNTLFVVIERPCQASNFHQTVNIWQARQTIAL